MVLSGLLAKLGLADRSVLILRALDKLKKIGREKVAEEMMATTAATSEQAGKVLELAELEGDAQTILAALSKLVAGSAEGEQGVARLTDVVAGCRAAGVPPARLKLDPSIARGLDYYTGTIYETFLDRLPTIGSVCSGGRYDHLAGLYTRQELPGVGASLGLDRLLAAMEELGMIEKASTPAEVFIPYFDPEQLNYYLSLAAKIRAAGVRVELYPEPKKLGQQLKYADARGFRVALIAGSQEIAASTCQVKDLRTTAVETVPVESVVAAVKTLLQAS
jgi:histidyl-tRNA synthetase